MESNALLPEFGPPQSQQETKLLVVESESGVQQQPEELPVQTLSKRLTELQKESEPTTGSVSQSHRLEQVISQLKLMDSLYNEANSYISMDSSSSEKAPVMRLNESSQILQKHKLSPANNQSNIPKEPSALPFTASSAKIKACRAPLSRRFAHPCSCDSKNHHKSAGNHHSSNHNNQINNNNNITLNQPPPFPLYLYDPLSRKCLPTSRHRDMLLRDCLPLSANAINHRQNSLAQSLKQQQQTPTASDDVDNNHACIYDDLRCDSRRLKCVCKPSLHLYYESNWSTFGCVPINFTSPPEGVSCRKDQIYNVISKECQKIFDINDLPPSYMSGLSSNQFPFVTLALIWVLLLIVILTAKLRKIRTTTTRHHRHSSSLAMRNNRGLSQQRQYSYYGPPTLVHSIMAAFHGHQHLDQDGRRGSLDTNLDPTSRNYNDTDFFLAGGGARHRLSRELFGGEGGFTESQQSLNNPPPKFEDIYPSCPLEPPPPPPMSGQHPAQLARPLSNDNLPSYDEAMKLQNTKPPDVKE